MYACVCKQQHGAAAKRWRICSSELTPSNTRRLLQTFVAHISIFLRTLHTGMPNAVDAFAY
jgi:hypothetical protein